MAIKHSKTKVISFINLKGGVGKTTCAVNLACTIAARSIVRKADGKRGQPKVLFIDTDPQSNASLTVLSRVEYEARNPDDTDASNQTIYSIFHQAIHSETGETPKATGLRVRKELTVAVPGLARSNSGFSIDVIPSSLRLADIQDELVTYRSNFRSSTGILEDSLISLLRDRGDDKAYTHIFIDCPPSLGLITQNAMAITDHVFVPVFLDAYSHWGLDKISERIEFLKKRIAGCNAGIDGVIFSRVNTSATVFNEIYRKSFEEWLSQEIARIGMPSKFLKKAMKSRGDKEVRADDFIFETQIPDRDIVRKSEADGKPMISYECQNVPIENRFDARSDCIEVQRLYWEKLADEILSRIGSNA